jgi:coronin-1B/1C/6
MSHFVRASKYRHVYVETPKTEEQFTGFRLSTVTGEQSYIKCNTKYFAVGLQVGIPLAPRASL